MSDHDLSLLLLGWLVGVVLVAMVYAGAALVRRWKRRRRRTDT